MEDKLVFIKSEIFQTMLRICVKIACILLIVTFVFTFVFGVLRYNDIAMSPSLKDGDLVFYYRLDKKYVASDVVVTSNDNKQYVNRVVAVAGDVVDIKENGLYINGSRQQERYVFSVSERYESKVTFPLEVKKGEVFVLGDNRGYATDSRIFGCVKEADIKGKVLTIMRRRGF